MGISMEVCIIYTSMLLFLECPKFKWRHLNGMDDEEQELKYMLNEVMQFDKLFLI